MATNFMEAFNASEKHIAMLTKQLASARSKNLTMRSILETYDLWLDSSIKLENQDTNNPLTIEERIQIVRDSIKRLLLADNVGQT